MLHFSVLKSSPEHADPLQDGIGLVQVQVKFLTPPPHGTEHLPGLQSDQPPSTKKTSNTILIQCSVNCSVNCSILASAALRVASESHPASTSAPFPTTIWCGIVTRSAHD